MSPADTVSVKREREAHRMEHFALSKTAVVFLHKTVLEYWAWMKAVARGLGRQLVPGAHRQWEWLRCFPSLCFLG